jgi:hypothetical protein
MNDRPQKIEEIAQALSILLIGWETDTLRDGLRTLFRPLVKWSERAQFVVFFSSK